MENKFNTEVKRINGYLKEVITFIDSSGKPISHIVNPLMVELKPRDILQLFVGSFLIAAPLCLTEEVWNLSTSLRMVNTYALMVVSLITIISFIYLNFYRHRIKGNIVSFFKRVIATYVIATSSVILMLLLIDKFPFQETPLIAIKRVIIIGFPALFGAVITDYLK
jgi:uncharacterized membrane protein